MNSTDWDIDLDSGHLAHPSGLHAYIASPPAECGAIRCVGPFSSYKHHLDKKSVVKYTGDAIRAIEALEPFEGCFTYWGGIAAPESHSAQSVTILGQHFGFIPNPCFRTDLLLGSNQPAPTNCDLAREWTYDGDSPQIDHRLGYKFVFPPDDQHGSSIRGEVIALAEDTPDIQSELRSIIIRTLGSMAVAVLYELGHKFQFGARKKFKLRLQDDLP